MVEGLMFHSQLADYYGFLAFPGYQKCHLYHYLEESCNYKKLAQYYLTHYHKLILDKQFNNPKVIPEGWFNHVQLDVSVDTKQKAIKLGFEKWINWEQQVKDFYQKKYNELLNMGEADAALEIGLCMKEVANELAEAEQYHYRNLGMNYSLIDLTMLQDEIYDKYAKKIRNKFKDA